MTLEERIAELEKKLVEALARIAQLEAENRRLREVEEKWKRGYRTRSKRFSSKSEAQHKPSGTKWGRKAGHPGALRPCRSGWMRQ